MATSLTDGNWGSSGDFPPLKGLEPENNPGRHDNQPSTRAAGAPAPKYGFEAFMQHRLATSGGQLWGRRGAPAAYDKGEFAGMNDSQATERLHAEYAGMPDAQRQNWEGLAQGNDIRSSRELAAGQPAPSGKTDLTGAPPAMPPAPQPPYTANGANPVTPPASTPGWLSSSAAGGATPPAPAVAATPLAAHGIGAVTFNDGTPPPAPPAVAASAPAPAAFPAISNPPPPIQGGTINGMDGQKVVNDLAQRNASANTEAGRQNVPIIGSGSGTPATDASGGMPKPAQPAFPAIGGDIDPATGKKRVQMQNVA